MAHLASQFGYYRIGGMLCGVWHHDYLISFDNDYFLKSCEAVNEHDKTEQHHYT